MNLRPFLLNFSLLVGACSLAAVATAQDQTINGNLFVNSSLDVNGNTASFGANGLNPGYSLIYTNGTPATVDFSASAAGVNWIWSQATNQPQLKLNSSNTLSLFSTSNSTTPAIVLNPAGNSTFVQGLTVSGTLTASGGLTTTGNITTNGTVTGGATGLTLNAGGAGNQNISLMPTGNGNVGIGTTAPIEKLDVMGTAALSAIKGTTSSYNGGNITDSAPRKLFFDVRAGPDGSRYKIASIKFTGGLAASSLNGWLQVGGFHANYERAMHFEIKAFNMHDGSTSELRYIKQGQETSGLEVYKLDDGDGAGHDQYDVYVTSGFYTSVQGEITIVGSGNHPNVSVYAWQSGLNVGTTVPSGILQQPNSNYVLDTTGYVGIGTTAPSERLEVAGNLKVSGNIITPSGTLTLPSATGTLVTTIGNQAITGSTVLNGTTTINGATSISGTTTLGGSTAATQMKVDSSGNVGIGTADLTGNSGNMVYEGKLQIDANGADVTALNISGNSTHYAGLKVKIGAGNISGAPDYYDFTIRPSYGSGVSQGPDVSAIRINNTYARNYPDLLLLKAGGNVGIGTLSPTAKLDVAGAIKTTGGYVFQGPQTLTDPNLVPMQFLNYYGLQSLAVKFDGTNLADVLLSFKDSGSEVNNWSLGRWGARLDKTTATFNILAQPGATSDVFRVSTSGAAIPFLKITPSGNVGIGNTAPAEKLDVTGNAKVSGNLTVAGSVIGNLTSAAALSLTAGGTNQNITLTPSGTGSTTTASPVKITNTTASSSTTTGALTVAGGVGVTGTLTAGNVTTSGTVTAGTLTVTNVATSLTNLGIGTASTANFGAINAADPSFFYPAPVAKVSHTATTGPFLSAPQVVTVVGNFAYVGSSSSTSFQIIDITNPLLPVKRGSLVGTGVAPAANLSYPRGIAISGNYAYVTSSSNNSLQVINITAPDAPTATGSLLNGAGGALLSAPYGIAVSGSYAYIASSSSNALEIVNITNPAAPVHAGKLTDATKLLGARAVAVSGSYAYVVSNTGNCLTVVNISNPAAPTLAASLAHNAAGPLLAGPTAIAISGNYAYVTSATSNALQIIDISNPLVPVAKGSLVSGTAGAQLTSPSALTVVGTIAFVTASGTTKALQVIDVSNPLAPTPKGQLLDGIGGAALNVPTGIAVAGNYAYVVASSSNALQVLSIASGGGFQIQNTTVLTKDANNNLLLGSGLPTGKVAIGTTTATSRLTVAGTDATAANSVVNVTDSTAKSLLFVRNDGNVGIGTATPTEKLEVNGNVKLSGNLTMANKVFRLNDGRVELAGSGAYVAALEIVGGGDEVLRVKGIPRISLDPLTSGIPHGKFNFTNGGLAINYSDNASSSNILTASAALQFESNTIPSGGIAFGGDVNLYRSAAGILRTDGSFVTSGNVGIGTPTPTVKLDVVGDAKVSGTLTVKTVLRIPPSGDLGMGTFISGTNPATN